MRQFNIKTGSISSLPRENWIFTRAGNYVYPINIPNPADWVYSVSDVRISKSGFGGRVIDFNMEDGSVYTSQSTWNCAASYLPESEYNKIKETHSMYCIISHVPIKCDYYGALVTIEQESDIIFMDEEWVLGESDRGDKLAEYYAHKLGKDVYYRFTTVGGACMFHTTLYDMKET